MNTPSVVYVGARVDVVLRVGGEVIVLIVGGWHDVLRLGLVSVPLPCLVAGRTRSVFGRRFVVFNNRTVFIIRWLVVTFLLI